MEPDAIEELRRTTAKTLNDRIGKLSRVSSDSFAPASPGNDTGLIQYIDLAVKLLACHPVAAPIDEYPCDEVGFSGVGRQ